MPIKKVSKKTKSDKSFFHKIPKDMKDMLESDILLMQKWQKITEIAKNEWICWITMVKQEKTRSEHLKRFGEELLGGESDLVAGQVAHIEMLGRKSGSNNFLIVNLRV